MTNAPTPARRSAPLLWINLIVVLLAANWLVMSKEDHLANGRMVLLEVTKYDPRSLMQGDFMALTYPVCRQIQAQLDPEARGDGHVVIWVDADDVGHFRRLHDDTPLADDEALLHYRIHRRYMTTVRVAAEQFFFQEGMAEDFERARYAELRLTPAGATLLVALRDADRLRIGE